MSKEASTKIKRKKTGRPKNKEAANAVSSTQIACAQPKAKLRKSARTDTTHHKTTEENTSKIILDTEQFDNLEPRQIDKKYIEIILNQLPIPIAILKVINMNGEYQYIYEFANSAVAKMNNRTTEEHIGRTLEEIITNEKAANDIKANFHNVIKSKKTTIRQINIPIGGKEGHLLEFHFPIEYNNFIVSVGAALIDITELVQVREEAEKRSQELQESHENLELRVRERTAELQKEITERKRADKALNESEDRLNLALEATTDGVWDWNISTGHVFFSPQWFRSLGYEPGELEPHVSSWEKLVHPDDMPKLRETLNAHLEGKTPDYQFENRLLTKSGTYRWNLDRGRVVSWDQNGKPLRMVGTDTDITEQKSALEALHVSEKLFRQLAENIEEVFWMEDLEGKEIIYISPAFEKIWGLKCEDLIKNPQLWMESIHPEDKEKLFNLSPHGNRKALIAGTHRTEFRIIRPDGSVRWILDRAFPILNDEGKPIRIAGISQDITAFKLAEQDLRESTTQQLKNKNLALQEILGHVEVEKRQIIERIKVNSEELLLPLIKKLRGKDKRKNMIFDTLERTLLDLTSDFGVKISTTKKLSPKEIEIANLIKNGFESKEIASLLYISLATVESHRKTIRNKLGLKNEKINLTSYLRSI